MALPREPAGDDMALVISASKPPGGRKPMGGMRGEDMGGDSEESELPPGFESAAAEAFPDMDPANYPALKRLIALCMDSEAY